MRVQGIQKLTLLDYPGKAACTIFTAGCNFRCPYCHNASLVLNFEHNQELVIDDIFKFLKKRTGILDGVCISGGEPLIQPYIEEFLAEVKSMGYDIKLDTNGTSPKKMQDLVQKGLIDYVAMDIKNSKENYIKTIGLKRYNIEYIEESVLFLKTGAVPYEFRTTVVRELHETADFISIGRWLKGACRYYLQAYADSGDIIKPGMSAYGKEQMEEIKKIVQKDIKLVELRGI